MGIRNRCLRLKAGHHAREDALLAPAVVVRLGRAVFLGGIAPRQAIAIDEDYATQNTPAIDARLAMAHGRKRPKPVQSERGLAVKMPPELDPLRTRLTQRPAKDTRPTRWCSPDGFRTGVSPKIGPTAREFQKRAGISMVLMKASEVTGPAPGIVIRRMQTASAFAISRAMLHNSA